MAVCSVYDQQFVSVPGNIPLGYKYEAERQSAETHQIPVPPEEFGGETDYVKILLTIKQFLTVSVERNIMDFLLQSFKICS